jgi:hypothetical protein
VCKGTPSPIFFLLNWNSKYFKFISFFSQR